ncbi:hypothetical protein FBUS_07444 [Fasciolopsis buskii]|uniref:SH2 domain-containing protein n=1 Tax=Fasciolopsis buskii TaxID=27845 RepID=A0A8E0RSQ4_9TREM|nr:hypothetical protein FBUS_07444 [Fasciolopsis buski]
MGIDNASTDSCDDSWEARIGRVVSELTSLLFVDPSSLVPTESNSACPLFSTGQPLSVHVSGDELSSVGHHAKTSTGTSNSPSVSISYSQVTPIGTGGVPPSVNSNLKLLPLEEQPWFQQSLMRLEAEELCNQPEGSFLVRRSETCPSDYSL